MDRRIRQARYQPGVAQRLTNHRSTTHAFPHRPRQVRLQRQDPRYLWQYHHRAIQRGLQQRPQQRKQGLHRRHPVRSPSDLHALRLHFDSPSVEDVSAFDALVAMHAYLLESNPNCYFEVVYTRRTGWMAWICSNTVTDDADSKVLASGEGDSPEEACEQALDQLTTHADIGEDEVPY